MIVTNAFAQQYMTKNDGGGDDTDGNVGYADDVDDGADDDDDDDAAVVKTLTLEMITTDFLTKL